MVFLYCNIYIDMKNYEITSPVAGTITEINVKENQAISAGDTVALLEVMKMENEILSEVNGAILKVNVKPNQKVEADQVLFEVELNDQ